MSIAGNPNYRVDPTKDDFFKRLIDLRTAIKAELKATKKRLQAVREGLAIALGAEADARRSEEQALTAQADALDSDQLALKILANSTSYGIFVELIVADLDAPERLICYGPSGEGFPVESKKVEEPGRYFHPLLATLITGAARLMLGIAERLCIEKGLDWAFCDTDSLAIAKPDDMDQAEFLRAGAIDLRLVFAAKPLREKGVDIQNRRRKLSNCGARRRIRNSSRSIATASRRSDTPYSISERPAKSSFARPRRMGWGNTSRPTKPMTRRNPFQRPQFP